MAIGCPAACNCQRRQRLAGGGSRCHHRHLKQEGGCGCFRGGGGGGWGRGSQAVGSPAVLEKDVEAGSGREPLLPPAPQAGRRWLQAPLLWGKEVEVGREEGAATPCPALRHSFPPPPLCVRLACSAEAIPCSSFFAHICLQRPGKPFVTMHLAVSPFAVCKTVQIMRDTFHMRGNSNIFPDNNDLCWLHTVVIYYCSHPNLDNLWNSTP